MGTTREKRADSRSLHNSHEDRLATPSNREAFEGATPPARAPAASDGRPRLRDERHRPQTPPLPLFSMLTEPPPPRIFLLSPAHCGGKRAELLLGGGGRFALAHQLQEGGTIPLDEAFTFLSGLYFRGKLAYARRFARPPAGVLGVQVITTNRGLLPADTPVTAEELRAFATGAIHPLDPGYREPFLRDLMAIDRVASLATTLPDIVLLGSVATGKYVNVLLDVVGERLLFPTDFVGRGDMSRGALLLRAARAEEELAYAPVATTVRRGTRPRKTRPDHADDDTTTPAPAPAFEG